MSNHYQGYSEKTNVADPSDTIQCCGEDCPSCGASLKKEYNFDKFGDVALQAYQCRCNIFTVTKFDAFDLWVCNGYNEAAGVARCTKMDIDAKYGCLG